MNFPALKDAQDKLSAKRKALHEIFEQAGTDMDLTKVKSIDGDTKAKVDHIRSLNAEIDEAADEVKSLQDVARAAERAVDPEAKAAEAGDARTDGPVTVKSFGELFTASDAYRLKSGSQGPEAHIDIELKTLMETGAGFAPETTRTGRIVDSAQPATTQILDVVPLGSTKQTAVVYMEETTHTNNAAETAEGGTYGEAALALTEKSSSVRKITVWLPVTDEQLEDEPQAQGYVNRRLPFMVRQRLGSQILVGNGTAPNLRGFLNVVGIQTQAKGADPVPDAVYKAMTKVQVTGDAMPGAVVFHPNDWQDIRLLRTADGIYIWGSPSEAGPERLWGLPVIKTPAITENTALVGDFEGYSELAVKRGIDVQVSNSHGTFFVEGKQAVRADMRAALVVYRPAAFATVTGI